MNYKEVSKGLPIEEAERYSQGIAVVGTLVDSLRKQGLLPKRFVQDKTNSLTQIVREFNISSLTPKLVTTTFQKIWQVRAESAGLAVTVSLCDRTVEELSELAKAGRRIGYLPEQVMRQQDRPLLAKMFPKLGSYSIQEGNPVTNEVNRFGWFDYEASVDAPFPSTSEQQLVDAIVVEGKRWGRNLVGMNLNEYVVAGEDSKLFTGRYLDTGSTYARLLGSRNDGKVVYANFYPYGCLYVCWYLASQSHSPYLGGRSVGVKSA